MTSRQSSTPTRSRVLAWSFWDFGSAAFNAVIVTFIFSVYLTDAVGKNLPGSISANQWLAWSMAAGSLVIAVLAPALGRRTDGAGARKRSLIALTTAVVAMMAALFFVQNDYHYLWLGLLLLAVGSILFELAQVPYFAMIRQVSTPETIGRVSGIGWAFGYVGGIVLLLICYFGFVVGDGPHRGFLNVPTENGMNIRLVALLAAAWFLIFALPLFFSVPEKDARAESSDRFLDAYREVFADVATMWTSDRATLKFLLASAVFRDGLNGVFSFGAVIAVAAYGIDPGDVILFGVAANVIAAIGAAAAGRIDDAMGPRPVIVFSLVAMLITGLVLFFSSGPLMFWICGLILCLFVGPAQSASRSQLTRMTLPGHEGQNFGLYAMTGRAVSFLAPALYGLAIAIGGADHFGILGIMVVLALGLALLLMVPAHTTDKAAAGASSSNEGI